MRWRGHSVRRLLTIGAVEAMVLIALLGCFSIAAGHTYLTYGKKVKAGKKPAYAISSSLGKSRTLLSIPKAAPGDVGSSRMLLKNVGTKPARIIGTKQAVVNSALTPYLSLSVYDANTKECLYPAVKKPKPKKPKKGKKALRPKPSGPCKGVAPWSKLPKTVALPAKVQGKYVVKGPAAVQWKRKENHWIYVRWAVAANTPNALQNTRSSFTIRWRARK